MEVGETKTQTITKEPSNATWASVSDFTWSSSNTAVASISSTGSINAISKGSTIINITHKLSGVSFAKSIIVYKKAIIILPGIMGSQLYADEDITIGNNTFTKGTRL